MKLDNEENRNGHQKPNGPSPDKDESAPNVGTNTPTDKHRIPENRNNDGNQSNFGGFMPGAHSCHTQLGTVKMSSAGRKKQDGAQTPNASGTHSNQEQDVPPVPKPQSPRSLQESRAAWKDTQLARDLEKVFQDNSDHGPGPNASSHSSSDTGSKNGRGPSHKEADHVSKWAESVVSEMRPEDVDDNSPSRLEWLRQKQEDNEKNPFLDQLMSMVGLEQVKAHFLAVKARVKANKSDGVKPTKLRLHLVLQGKDGTGKKSIAKLYAQFLYSIGAVEDKVTARCSNLQSLILGSLGRGYSMPSLFPEPMPFPELPKQPVKPTPGLDPYGRGPSKPPPAPPKNPTVLFYYKPASGPMNPYRRYDGFPDSDNDDIDDFLPIDAFPTMPRRTERPAERDERLEDAEINKLMKIAEKSVLILSSRKTSLVDSIENNETALQELPTPLILSDYNDDELNRLLVRIIQKKGLLVEGGFQDPSLRALVQRVARERKSKSFSNVHHLQKELDKACRRRALRMQREYSQWFGGFSDGEVQASRLLDRMNQRHNEGEADKAPKAAEMVDDQNNILTSKDLLGPEPRDIRRDNASWEKLQNMIGLEKVKAECGDIIDYAQINHRRQLLGKEPLKIGLNRLFLGPPGVGKTTVAQLYGQILIDLGLVSGKQIMLKNPSHLIGQYIGRSEEKTKKVLDSAKGNVLIIDDAHMLYPGSTGANHKTDVFRVAVLDTLVANVSADPEDRCILLLGYEHDMVQLFNNSNPGLQRRFPRETALRFETYSEDELCQIMDLKAGECGLEMTDEARAVSRQVLSRMRINPKFGNAGDVDTLLNQAKYRVNARIRHASCESGTVEVALEPGDIDPQWDRALRADENRAALFDNFVGFKKIIKKFEGYQLQVDGMQLHGIDPKPYIPWAFIFKGPPGTGKTSTARKVGRLYYDMGLLSTDEVVTCSVTDLVGEGIGQTGPKVLNTLETGLGKVLFIDEAYRLAGSSVFHMEAIEELVDAMTRPRYNKNMVVILAGYTIEMEFLLRTNPGLRSRFPEQVVFPTMTPPACFEHLKHEVQKLKINIPGEEDADDEEMEMVYRLFERLSHTPGWASGRDVETLARTIIGNVYMREGRSGKGGTVDPLSYSIDELIGVLKAMRKERKGRKDNRADE